MLPALAKLILEKCFFNCKVVTLKDWMIIAISSDGLSSEIIVTLTAIIFKALTLPYA
jgi:hypothetical protein